MDLRQLAELQSVAKAQFDREARDLHQAVAAEDKLSEELAEIDASEKKRAQALTGDIKMAFAQTGEVLWRNWAEQRRKDILMALANQRAITEAIKTRARTAFGQTTALKAIEDEMRVERNELADKAEHETLVDFEVQKSWMRGPGT